MQVPNIPRLQLHNPFKPGDLENLTMKDAVERLEQIRSSLNFTLSKTEEDELDKTVIAQACFLKAIAALETTQQELILAIAFCHEELA